SITIVPSDSLQQHLVAAKFASGTGFLPPETEATKATSETLSAYRDRKVAVRKSREMAEKSRRAASVGQNRVSARCALSASNGTFRCGDRGSVAKPRTRLRALL